MVKATEFWNFLCEEMDYRLFSGVPCLELKPLYDKMSPKFLHYMPATDERAAFGIALGAAMSDVKTGVLVKSNYLDLAKDWMDMCVRFQKHIVVLTDKQIVRRVHTIVFDGDYEKLKKALNKKQKEGKLAIIVLEGIK